MKKPVAILVGIFVAAVLGPVPLAQSSVNRIDPTPFLTAAGEAPPPGVTITYTRDQLKDLCKSLTYPTAGIANQGECVASVDVYYKDGLTITGQIPD